MLKKFHGWTIGSPVSFEKQRLRLYTDGALAGTFDFGNDTNEYPGVEIGTGAHVAVLCSVREEVNESTSLQVRFQIGENSGGPIQDDNYQPPETECGEYVPPPTGTLQVSDDD